MTYRTALGEGTSFLEGLETPYLDSLILLSHASGLTKEKLLAALPETGDPDAIIRYRGYLARRREGIPVSYIRRKKEFWGREFYVDERVLVPRPDTEILVETALTLVSDRPLAIHDCCTGSGCVAVTLKLELPVLEVSGSDVSPDALEVYALNCSRLIGHPLPAYASDLMASVPGLFDIVTANPPYIADNEVVEMVRSGWPEPVLALDGGERGDEVTLRLIDECRSALTRGGHLVLESAPALIDSITDTMKRTGYRSVTGVRDLTGRVRVVHGRWDG